MLFHRRRHTQVALHSPGIVITDVVFKHLYKFLLAGETPAVIAFPLQDAPESFHRAIDYAVGHTGHTLTSLYEFVVECSACVLEASIAVEQRMGIRVCLNSLVKGFVNEWTQHKGHDTPVTEIQNGAQIEFMYLDAFVPFELHHIGKPFLIRLLRIELAVQQIFSKILRVLCPSGAATVIVLHSGAYISGPADAQHSLVIDIDTMVMTQIVIKPPVAFIRTFRMNLLNLAGQLLILCSHVAQFPRSPFVVSGTGYMQQFTGRVNRKPLFLMALFKGRIYVPLSYF